MFVLLFQSILSLNKITLKQTLIYSTELGVRFPI